MRDFVRRSRDYSGSGLDFSSVIGSSFFKDFETIFGDNRYTNKEGNLVYEIECPGFNKDNLTVDISEGVLTVKGKRGEGENRKEIFKRFTVGQSETVEAEIKDGILTLIFKQPETKVTKLTLK